LSSKYSDIKATLSLKRKVKKMQAYNMISIVNDINAPPGILHPILTEKWAWVDGRLREIYYGEDYDELNEETFDIEIFEEVSLEEDTLNEGFLEEEEEEEEENGLFKENWGWVDERLRELYYGYGLNDETFDEYQGEGLLKENWAWVDERLSEKYDLEPIENVSLTQCPLTWMDYRFGLEATPQTLEEMSYIPPIRREDPYNPFNSSDFNIEAHLQDLEEMTYIPSIRREDPYNPVDCSKLFGICDEDILMELESSLDLGSNVNTDELLDDYEFDSEEFEFYNNCVKVDIGIDACIEIVY
jgi:hypothetical protein